MSATYIQYNHALNEIFFSGRFAWRPVYLSLDARMRLELAGMLGEDEEGLEEKICRVAGHVLDRSGDPYASINDHARMWWIKSRSAPPPFTALLFTLSHAAALMAAEGDFGSNNYYLRLAQVTGRERQVLSFHGKSTDRLWERLNSWLVENNYEFGRPTAAEINKWTYVGKALSQVVVRAGDRELFHDLFARYGFSGNESISPDEMRHYLANWILTSKPNRRLKAAWQKPELQQRVCEAAIAELSHWGSADGTPAKGAISLGKRSVKLSLIASFVTRFPRPTMLDLQLGRTEERNEPLRPLSIEGAPGQEFSLANEDFGTFATILPRPISADGRSLSRSYSFVVPGQETNLDWHPRLVIPLAKANDGPYWIEVARVTFGQPHLILVRNVSSFPKKVESYLSDAALEMPAKLTSQELPGLPADWVLYKDARLGQPSSTPPLDLDALVPIGDEGALLVEGSFQLARGIFHSRASLVASFQASTGPTEIFAMPMGATTGEILRRAKDAGKACRLEIPAGAAKGHSGLRLESRKGPAVVANTEILLRDANNPRALDRQGRDALSYASIMSAAGHEQSPGQEIPIRVEGMLAVGVDTMDDDLGTSSIEGELPTGDWEEPQDANLASPILNHVGNQTCAERGYHIWLCETLEPGRPKKTPLRQECKDCGQAIVVVDRGKATARVLAPSLRPLKTFTGIGSPDASRIEHDLLLDALCFLGTGSWGRFESLLADKVEMPWQAREIAQNYSLLGLLDIDLRPGTNIVHRWSIPPCAVSYIDEETAFLSGFRCQSLLESIFSAVRRADGQIVEARRSLVPAHIEITNLSPAALSRALEGIADPLGRSISVNQYPGREIARACREWSNLDSCLIPISMGRQANLQVFNLQTARWDTVSAISAQGGAYRWNDGRQAYAFVEESGRSLAGPHQVVKLMAARSRRRRLHAYDAKKQAFLATLGCDAPGLLGRALVACSGTLPEISEGLLKYSNVDPATARLVLDALYEKEEARDEARYAHQRH
ncbi:hypothetical protein AB4Z34_31455 [Ensifer sp. 2YAB10]|uniref:hypothetical protein n=1 Tax=Ensifer sp. 2YAB10 TaxID=3233021 RepID=UPI003F8FE2E8